MAPAQSWFEMFHLACLQRRVRGFARLPSAFEDKSSHSDKQSVTACLAAHEEQSMRGIPFSGRTPKRKRFMGEVSDGGAESEIPQRSHSRDY